MNSQYDIPYGTEQHRLLLTEIQRQRCSSYNKMATLRRKWDDAEKLYRAYIPTTAIDRERKNRQDVDGIPQFTTLYVPYAYATLLAAHTYWSSVFLARDPVYQLTGRHGETQEQTMAFEAVLDYHRLIGGHNVVHYGALMDAGKFGVGVIGQYWEEDIAVTHTYEEVPEKIFTVETDKTKKRLVKKITKGFSGIRLYNISPYDFYPDPSVSLANFQRGEFCGRGTYQGLNSFRKLIAQGLAFNEKACLESLSSGFQRDRGISTITFPDSDTDKGTNGQKTGTYERYEHVWEIVPAKWGLGDSTYPEKWVFVVANQAVIIQAQPLGLVHDKFPYDILMYEVDPYTYSYRGMMEVIEPLNHTISWLLNTHFYNVRASQNGNFVLDPSRVTMADLKGGPGKLIRLKPGAYGSDIRSVIQQLSFQDVTRQNIGDIGLVMDIGMRVTGVSDQIQGALGRGGRKTATEVRSSGNFGINRMRSFCEYNSDLCWTPMMLKMVQTTQQMFSSSYGAEKVFRIAGDLLNRNSRFMQVTPDHIAGNYDFIPVDGTMPIDRLAQAQLWKELMASVVQLPPVMQQYDIGGIFSWVAQLSGLKNISRFKIAPTDPGQLAAMAQAGNIVPTNAIPGQGTPGGIGTREPPQS